MHYEFISILQEKKGRNFKMSHPHINDKQWNNVNVLSFPTKIKTLLIIPNPFLNAGRNESLRKDEAGKNMNVLLRSNVCILTIMMWSQGSYFWSVTQSLNLFTDCFCWDFMKSVGVWVNKERLSTSLACINRQTQQGARCLSQLQSSQQNCSYHWGWNL